MPEIYKGIALFTPAGDVIYSIDPHKQGRWHLHLCAALQTILGLPEPPHFLVPCYTATIDHWRDPRTQQIKTFAEAYPKVLRYQGLLNAIFGTKELVWQPSPWQAGLCDRLVLEGYRETFPQLWEDHDLIVCLDRREPTPQYTPTVRTSQPTQSKTQGYVLRLFVAGHSIATENILKNLHDMLEKYLSQPYSLKVIDVLKNPEQAEADQVSATPTLVKAYPQPIRRIVGDLNNAQKILQALANGD